MKQRVTAKVISAVIYAILLGIPYGIFLYGLVDEFDKAELLNVTRGQMLYWVVLVVGIMESIALLIITVITRISLYKKSKQKLKEVIMVESKENVKMNAKGITMVIFWNYIISGSILIAIVYKRGYFNVSVLEPIKVLLIWAIAIAVISWILVYVAIIIPWHKDGNTSDEGT